MLLDGFISTVDIELVAVETLEVRNGTLSLDEAVSIENYLQRGGVLTGAENLEATQSVTWTGGAMIGAGPSAIESSGTLTISGGFTKLLDGRVIRNAGVATWTGGDIEGSTGAFHNLLEAALDGAGSLSGNLINDGQLRPAGPGMVGTISVNGSFSQGASGTLHVELGSGGSGSDRLVVSGLISLDGSLNAIELPGFMEDSVILIENTGPDPVVGTFSGLPEGAVLSIGGREFVISYVAGSGNDVKLAAVVNVPPVAIDDSYSVDEDGTLTVDVPGVLDNDDDPDGDPFTVVAVNGSAANIGVPITLDSDATLTVNGDGSFTYTPSPDWNGTDSFTYQATDGLADSNEATVTITVNSINDAPVAGDDSYSTDEDTEVSGNVLDNDDDSHGGAPGENNVPLTAQLVSDPSNFASFTFNSDGTFSYTPGINFNGTDSFTYQAIDSLSGVSTTATVTITVNSVNAPPILDPIGNQSVDEGQELIFIATATDPDGGDSLTFTLDNAPEGASIGAETGIFTWTPAAAGSYTFIVRVTDNGTGNLFDEEEITVTVTVNDVPAGTITGRAWEDLDEDGIRDTGEEGLANILVSLYDANDNLIDSYITNSNGGYEFSVAAGSGYYVRFEALELGAHLFGPKDQEGDDTVDSDVNEFGFSDPFEVLPGQSVQHVDAAYILLGGGG